MATVHSRAIDVVRAESSRRAREGRHRRLQPEPEYDLEHEIVELSARRAGARRVRRAVGRRAAGHRARVPRGSHLPGGRGAARPARGHSEESDTGGVASSARHARRVGDHVVVDRELTRTELDELLPLFALDALDGEEREQVARYVERDGDARAEVESLRDAVSFLPASDVRAPSTLWAGIEGALDAPASELSAPPLRLVSGDAPVAEPAHRGRRVVALLAAAAIVPRRRARRAGRAPAGTDRRPRGRDALRSDGAASDGRAWVVGRPRDLARRHGGRWRRRGRDVARRHWLPHRARSSRRSHGDRTYQLWAKVGDGDTARMVSLGLLGHEPGISPFRLAATPTMFEVTTEPATGSAEPGAGIVLRGEVV